MLLRAIELAAFADRIHFVSFAISFLLLAGAGGATRRAKAGA